MGSFMKCMRLVVVEGHQENRTAADGGQQISQCPRRWERDPWDDSRKFIDDRKLCGVADIPVIYLVEVQAKRNLIKFSKVK